MMPRIVFRALRVAGLLVATASPRAFAQAPATVQVRVTDTAGAPISGVNLMILKGREQELVVLATTDAAGKHTFTFTPDSASYRLNVRKVGYVQTARLIAAAPGETSSFDLVLAAVPAVTTLPAIVSSARGPADTVRSLELSGFYDRQKSGLASSFSFATEDRIRSLTHWVDAGALMGSRHSICIGNLYIDGTKVRIRILKDLDNFLNPATVSGMETYGFGEAPASFSRLPPDADLTRRLAAGAIGSYHNPDCVTLIWLK